MDPESSFSQILQSILTKRYLWSKVKYSNDISKYCDALISEIVDAYEETFCWGTVPHWPSSDQWEEDFKIIDFLSDFHEVGVQTRNGTFYRLRPYYYYQFVGKYTLGDCITICQTLGHIRTTVTYLGRI